MRDRVLVKELPWRETTRSGLHLPQQAKEHDHVWRAVVVSVGEGKPPVKLLRRVLNERPDIVLLAEIRDGLERGFGADVKPGDVVLVSKYMHSKIGYGSETLCLIAADDILGVVEDDSEQLRRALETALQKLDLAGFGEAV